MGHVPLPKCATFTSIVILNKSELENMVKGIDGKDVMIISIFDHF